MQRLQSSPFSPYLCLPDQQADLFRKLLLFPDDSFHSREAESCRIGEWELTWAGERGLVRRLLDLRWYPPTPDRLPLNILFLCCGPFVWNQFADSMARLPCVNPEWLPASEQNSLQVFRQIGFRVNHNTGGLRHVCRERMQSDSSDVQLFLSWVKDFERRAEALLQPGDELLNVEETFSSAGIVLSDAIVLRVEDHNGIRYEDPRATKFEMFYDTRNSHPRVVLDETLVDAETLAAHVPTTARTIQNALNAECCNPCTVGKGQGGKHEWYYCVAVNALRNVNTATLKAVSWPDTKAELTPRKISSKFPASKGN